MGRRAISDGEETQEREREAVVPKHNTLIMKYNTKGFSTEWPQQLSDLFSVQARVTRGGGEGNSRSCPICRIFREIISFCHFKIKSGSCQPMF